MQVSRVVPALRALEDARGFDVVIASVSSNAAQLARRMRAARHATPVGRPDRRQAISLLGVDRADASGRARSAQLVPASLSGTELVFQTLSFDPLLPAAGCETTGVVRFVYP